MYIASASRARISDTGESVANDSGYGLGALSSEVSGDQDAPTHEQGSGSTDNTLTIDVTQQSGLRPNTILLPDRGAIEAAPTGSFLNFRAPNIADLTGFAVTVSGLTSYDRVSITNQGDSPGQIGINGSRVSFGGVEIGTVAGGAGTTLTITLNGAATGAAVEAIGHALQYQLAAGAGVVSDHTLHFDLNRPDGTAVYQRSPWEAAPSDAPRDNPFEGIELGLTRRVALGDVNGDGHLDLVVAGDPVYTWIPVEDLPEEWSQPIYRVGANGEYEVTDRILGAGPAGYLYLGGADGLFDQAPTVLNLPKGQDDDFSVALADADGDGDLDIFYTTRLFLMGSVDQSTLTGESNTRDSRISLLINNGTGQFSDIGYVTDYLTLILDYRIEEHAATDIVAGDIAGDGVTRALFGSYSTIRLAEGTGPSWDFGEIASDHQTIGLGHRNMALVDADGDGDLDLYVSTPAQGPRGAVNTTGTSFAPMGGWDPFLFLGNNAEDVSFADLDGDHDLDMLVSRGGALTVQWNTARTGYVTDRAPGAAIPVDYQFPNVAPVANEDSVSVAEDSGTNDLTAQLLSNDADPESNTKTITSATQGNFGTTSVVGGVLTYTPDGNYNGTDSFTYTIDDGNGGTDTASVNVTVTAVNDPVTGSAPAAVSVNENSAANAITGLSISDIDATLAPAGVYDVTLSATQGTLTLTTTTGLTFTIGDGDGDTTTTFHGTLGDINTALATTRYTPPPDYSGPAQIQLLVTDTYGAAVATGTGAATNDSDIVAVTVTGVNDAPVLDLNGSDGEGTGFVSGVFIENGNAGEGIADNDVSITDADVGDLVEGATITITDAIAGDRLTIFGTLPGSIVATGSGTGTLTLSGTGTQAEYQTALTQVRYSSTSEDPTVGDTDLTRSVTVTVTDGSATSAIATTTVPIIGRNDAPAGTSKTIAGTEDTAITITAADFGFSDLDGDTLSAVRFTVLPNGTLTYSGTGAAVAINTNFDLTGGQTFTYTPAANINGATASTLSFRVVDNGGTADGGVDTDPSANTLTFNVTAVNDGPVIDLDASGAGTGFASAYTEGGAAAAISDVDVIITDADAGDNVDGATITITNPVAGDVLTIVGALPGSITVNPSSTATNIILTGSGTQAEYAAAIEQITFSNTGDNPTAGGTNLSRTINVTVTDGDSPSNVAVSTISVADDNADAPSGTSATIAATEDTFRLLSTADFGAVDVDGIFVSVTLTGVTGGSIYFDSDGSAGPGAPVAATLPATYTVQDLVDGKVSFRAAPNASGTSASTIAFAVTDDDGNTDGTPNTLTVNVDPVNDAPTVAIVPGGGTLAPVGGEVLINATTLNGQGNPSVTALSGGGYVVTWSGDGAGDPEGVFARRYDTAGVAQSGEILVNGTTLNGQGDPSVAPLSGGGYVVTWSGQGTGDTDGVFVRRFDAAGVAQGSELRVNATAAGTQFEPSVAALSGGGYVVTWSGQGAGDSNGVFARRYDAAGVAQGGEVLVNATTTSGQGGSSVAALSGGDYVVTWWGTGAGDTEGVFARRYDAAGVAQSGEVLVNATTSGSQTTPSVAALSGGGYVVTWYGQGAGDTQGIFAQRYDASGVAQGGEMLVNATTTGNQFDPSVAALSSGGYVVTWWGEGANDTQGIFARYYDAAGVAQGGETLVNATTAGDQYQPSVAALPGGGYVVTWWGNGASDTVGVFAQRYQPMAGTFTANEQTALNLRGAVTVADADAGGGTVTATLAVGYGVLNVTAGTSGATIVSGNGTGSVVVSGTIAQLNALLNTDGTSTLAYTANADSPPASTTLTVSVNDNGNSGGGAQIGSDSETITISATNDAPTNTVPLATQNGTEDTNLIFSNANGNAITVSDPDATSLTVTLAVTNGVLTLSGTVGLNFDAGDGTADATMTFSGTAAAINTALNGLAYRGNLNFEGSETLTVTTIDNGSTGAGGTLTDTDTVAINLADDGRITGGSGNDGSPGAPIPGTALSDFFDLRQGGDDNVSGLGGDDGFYFGAAYTSADVVDGGAGTLDQIGLQGNYSGVTLGSLLGTELVVLLSSNDTRFGGQSATPFTYDVIADAGTMASNNRLIIQANTLGAADNLIFNGSASGIDFLIYGGLGTDNLTGGAGNDGFYFGEGRFGSSDVVNGGAGTMDQLGLQGNFTTTFGAGQMSGVEFIVLLSASDNRFGSVNGTVSYNLTMNNGNVALDQTLVIQGNTLKAGEVLIFNGSAEADGSFRIFSGAANDTITGGAGADLIVGRLGADTLSGGGGPDTFQYIEAADSVGGSTDQILDFSHLVDRIDLSVIDAASNVAGKQDFNFIGSAAFGGTGTGSAGELRAFLNNGVWVVEGDTDGDGDADLNLAVTVVGGQPLTREDFRLAVGEAQEGGTAKQAASAEPAAALAMGADKYLGIASGRDLGGPDLTHVSSDLHLVSASYDLMV